ncbi:MAG: hypothetical protein KJN72_10690 [Woeseia sp.]|nr:hypothetical protein [Woeseia sp.]
MNEELVAAIDTIIAQRLTGADAGRVINERLVDRVSAATEVASADALRKTVRQMLVQFQSLSIQHDVPSEKVARAYAIALEHLQTKAAGARGKAAEL